MAKQNTNSELDNLDDPQLIAKVDKMMDIDPPETTQAVESDSSKVVIADQPQPAIPPAIDIFKDTPSAPLLTGRGRPIKIVSQEAASSIPVVVDKPVESPISEQSTKVITDPETVNEYDDPQTAALVDQIVATEAKPVPIQRFEPKAKGKSSAHGRRKGHHPIFWVLVVILCIMAAITVLYMSDPSFHLPLTKTKQLFDRLNRKV